MHPSYGILSLLGFSLFQSCMLPFPRGMMGSKVNIPPSILRWASGLPLLTARQPAYLKKLITANRQSTHPNIPIKSLCFLLPGVTTNQPGCNLQFIVVHCSSYWGLLRPRIGRGLCASL